MKKGKRWMAIILAALLILISAGCGGNESKDTTTKGTEVTAGSEQETEAAEVTTESKEGTEAAEATTESKEKTVQAETVVIDVKDYGKIKVKLNPDEAPITTANFLKLVQSGFYDGLTFHRIMEGFMIQGGDPQGNGTGGSDETIKGEFSLNGVKNNISHVRGTISMARAQDPDSASSQFFIVQKDSLFLDGQYAGFGEVTEGMDIVDKICEDAEPIDDNGTIPPEKQPVITSITVE